MVTALLLLLWAGGQAATLGPHVQNATIGRLYMETVGSVSGSGLLILQSFRSTAPVSTCSNIPTRSRRRPEGHSGLFNRNEQFLYLVHLYCILEVSEASGRSNF
jgi:hypothetical protein